MWQLLPSRRNTDRANIKKKGLNVRTPSLPQVYWSCRNRNEGVNLTTTFLPRERWSCRNKMRRLDATTTSRPQKHWSCRNTKEGGECDNYFPPVETIETRGLNLTTTSPPQEYLSCRNKMRRLNVTTTSRPQKHWSCRNTNEGIECVNYFPLTRALIVPKYKRGGRMWQLLPSHMSIDRAEIQTRGLHLTTTSIPQEHWSCQK